MKRAKTDKIYCDNSAIQGFTDKKGGAENRINIPTTLREFTNNVGNMPENFSAAYYAHFESREGKIGVIFTSDQLVAPLNNPDTEDLFINGTFDSRPTEPKSCQLLIINIKRRDAGIPDVGYTTSGRPHGGGGVCGCRRPRNGKES
ncbi:hypothetical protein PV327_001668 [Microctonus hyperodae]|uniref:Uncharacterized protein n=1 Tax=Microctonus hyperodae TaxID=165561 RepID=A0AA39FE01_MICHY|nr:hypothetical protein PV327_001668 [Microctonus hyperodae]